MLRSLGVTAVFVTLVSTPDRLSCRCLCLIPFQELFGLFFSQRRFRDFFCLPVILDRLPFEVKRFFFL